MDGVFLPRPSPWRIAAQSAGLWDYTAAPTFVWKAKREALEAIVSTPAPAPQDPQPTEEEKPAKVQPIQ
jgi:hypothetical protein